MGAEVMRAGDACRLIRRLEQNLEMPVVAVVCMERSGELAFVLPGETDERYVLWALEQIAAACQDASKRL